MTHFNQVVTLKVKCSHCGATNELSAAHLAQHTRLDCSTCHVTLGTWGNLTRKPEPIPAIAAE